MLRRRISKAGVVLALALACGTSAHAESSLDAVRARGRIRVGVKTDAAPFGFIDARGHPCGFEVDLARFFARVLFDDDGRARRGRMPSGVAKPTPSSTTTWLSSPWRAAIQHCASPARPSGHERTSRQPGRRTRA